MCSEIAKDPDISPANWEILLNGSDRDRALAAIYDIAQGLLAPPVAWIPDFETEPSRIVRGITLRSGSPSLALFYAYYGKSLKTVSSYAEQITRYLEYTGTGLEVVRLEPGFMMGLSGVLWALDHITTLTREPLEGLDETMADSDTFLVDHSLAEEGFDLWLGLVGQGIYAIPRAGQPSARLLLVSIVERLLSAYNPDAHEAPWTLQPKLLKKPDRVSPPFPHTHLGAAHGIAGLVTFLAEAHRRGLGEGNLPAICDRTWRWLDAQQAEDDQGTFWPNFASKTVKPTRGMEMWCNGMPGIASTLFAAAQKLDHTEMRAWSLARARELASIPQDSAEFNDISLCHGTAGLGHMFNRFFQQTGDELFAETARFYLQRTLDLQKPGYGVGGFTAYGIDMLDDYGDLFDPGLMIGSSGVGLALLAAVSNQAPHWDQALLLS